MDDRNIFAFHVVSRSIHICEADHDATLCAEQPLRNQLHTEIKLADL